MKKDVIVRYKIRELTKLKGGRCGEVKINGKEPEPHEKRAIRCLSEYGFDVETIIPSNIPGSKNPDILMMDTFWEMRRIMIIKKDKKTGKKILDIIE